MRHFVSQVTELELEPILSGEEFPIVVHGTYYKCLESIKQQGLRCVDELFHFHI